MSGGNSSPVMPRERSPIAAVLAADPYPYYAELVARRPLAFDEDLGMWIATSAAAVRAVLEEPTLRVRPRSEPVPAHLLGTAVGEIFARLIRMTDGAEQARLKAITSETFAHASGAEIERASERGAVLTCEELAHEADVVTLCMMTIPARVTALLLGFDAETSREAARLTANFVRSIGSGAAAETVARGNEAVTRLRKLLLLLVADDDASLMARFAHAARNDGIDDIAIIANAIGFLMQSYDATAGLIGNTLALLAQDGVLRSSVRTSVDHRAKVIEEVARWDAPVQNTRRYAAQNVTLLGANIQAGDSVLVVLAAANRDPSTNPDPTTFDPARLVRQTFTFGLGMHACVGARLAIAIASAAINALLDAGLDVAALRVTGYRPLPNARIPQFVETGPLSV